MTTEDWTAVAAIYADGIATGDATFETDVPDWLDWDAEHLTACRLALHRDAGFRVIGTRERLGEMNGIWRDVTLLERRSKTIGV